MVLTKRIEAEKLNSAINMLRVISHPIRLAIVDLLTINKRLTILEIQEQLSLGQAIASQHVTLMEDKGVLKSEKVGRNKFVSLSFPKMKNIVTCLESCCNEQ